jgi:hypothetical protein
MRIINDSQILICTVLYRIDLRPRGCLCIELWIEQIWLFQQVSYSDLDPGKNYQVVFCIQGSFSNNRS